MSLHKKIMVSISMVFLQNVSAMEPGSYLPLATYVPAGATELANSAWAMLATNLSSAATTVTNKVSDHAAFAKLGFPPSAVNNAELLKCKAIQKRHAQAIIDGKADEEFFSDAAYLNRRQEYVKRAINALPTYPQAVELAIFCLNNHQQVMNSFDIARMVTFVQSKKQSSEEKVQQLSTELSQLVVSADNSLLASVLQGSGLQRNNNEQRVEKKEEKK
jgi:hypothetical protein